MKTQSKQQIAYQALFDEAAVFDDDDVYEILEKKDAERIENAEREAAAERVRLRNQYFWGGECRVHDRMGCPECSSYARGECPSTREEYGYSGW